MPDDHQWSAARGAHPRDTRFPLVCARCSVRDDTPQADQPCAGKAYVDPPTGWYRFGTHAGWDQAPLLEFSEEVDEAGMPLFERRVDIKGIAPCGGCRGLGAHQKHCHRSPTYNVFAELADRAEDLGDRIGPNEMGAANHCYAASGLLRQLVSEGRGYLRTPVERDADV